MSTQIKPSEDKQISKTLSWILRHGALKLGLRIDSEGFIDVNSILSSNPFKDKKCSVQDIQRIVEYNDKQRFTLRFNNNSDQLEIRANQGHSLKVVNSLELHPITDSYTGDVIHGTYRRFWKSIKEFGLSRMNRLHIHFASELPNSGQVVSGARSDCEIYIYIDLVKALNDGFKFFKSTNNVILCPGDKNGVMGTKYFLKVIDAKTGLDYKMDF